MQNIYYLYPADLSGYRYLQDQIGPKLDDAGISFHIAKPEENILETILKSEGRARPFGSPLDERG